MSNLFYVDDDDDVMKTLPISVVFKPQKD